MPPRGEVREALAKALEQLHQVRGAVSTRMLAHEAQVSVNNARATLDRMVEAGEVDVVGFSKEPGQRWHRLFAPPAPDGEAAPADPGMAVLTAAMRSFATTSALDAP